MSDPTGDQRITAFNEAAEAMLGKTAEDIGKMQEYDKTGYSQVFEDVKFKTFLFKFRTKMETFSVSINIREILYTTVSHRALAHCHAPSSSSSRETTWRRKGPGKERR